MTFIQIEKLPNGAHENYSYYDESAKVELQDGWAVVSEKLEPLENFPFGDVEVEEINGVMTVTKWTPLPIPQPPPPEPEPPSELDKLQAQVLYTAVETNTLLIEGGPTA